MIEIPEVLPLPIQQDEPKDVAPSAVKRSHPSFHDPQKEGESQQRRRKKRGRSSSASDDTAATDGVRDEDLDDRGRRIDVRA